MHWSEQPPDAAAGDLRQFLQTLPAVDALSVIRHVRVSHLIVWGSECRDGILAHVGRGRTELGGLLLGEAFVGDSSLTTRPVVMVDTFIPSRKFRSTGVSLEMGTAIWTELADRLSANRLVVGWYHSHPDLGAFFSSTDRSTQRAFFGNVYSLGLVVDPFREEEAWFGGPDAIPISPRNVVMRAQRLAD
jgi:proteasome lid subunit RPN8/RPN11